MKIAEYILIGIFFIFQASGCEEEGDLPCGVIDPLNELDWINEQQQVVDESCSSVEISLFQANYKGKTVFYNQVTDPLVSTVFFVALLNCEGEIIRTFDSSEQEVFYEKVKERAVIYSCGF